MKSLCRVNRIILGIAFFIPLISNAQQSPNTRDLWIGYLEKLARPVLSNLAEDNLKVTMPVALSPGIDNAEARKSYAYLEAFGRTLCGIAPWLNTEGGSEYEKELRNQYREWAVKSIAHAVDPSKNDYMQWNGYQPLVDASFFALALIRCPWLWDHLEEKVRSDVVRALQQTRSIIPVYTNWILFTGMIEAFFCKYGYDYDRVRIEYGIREFSQHWYVGDGLFSDGMHFTLDNYNSYVIQPFLTDILDAIEEKDKSFSWFVADMNNIASRFSEIQERTINADGSFPVYGRSIVYRGGAFHHLANMALKKKLPGSLSPEQVRCALTAVLKKTMDAPGTFTDGNWLNIGLHGHQPNLADPYINTGSLYLCSVIFLPLGLPADDPFWTQADAPWTAVKAWNGIDIPADHSYKKQH